MSRSIGNMIKLCFTDEYLSTGTVSSPSSSHGSLLEEAKEMLRSKSVEGVGCGGFRLARRHSCRSPLQLRSVADPRCPIDQAG